MLARYDAQGATNSKNGFNQQKQFPKVNTNNTNERLDDSILEQVFELLPPSEEGAVPLDSIIEDIANTVGINIQQVITAIINLADNEDGRVSVDKGSNGQVFVMKNE
jgi:hypothetical protein